MRKLLSSLFVVVLAIALSTNSVNACTNYLVTKKASVDGSTMITYAADSHALYGELYFWAAMDWSEGAMLKVYEWDTGKYLGEIAQVRHTYRVIGNMNENQVSIGETTYGGREGLVDTTGLVDYGSLIYIALQRSKSAREAIKVMTQLVEEYGYYSSGESFSIADANEVWILELIGKGTEMVTKGKGKKAVTYNKNKGAVWVARMIPDGYVSGHANQARIMQFPQEGDPSSISSKNIDKIFDTNVTTVYAHDVITFAREKKFITDAVSDADFSFSETYAPVNFGGARFCDMRVWTFFNRVKSGMDQYWDYAKGDVMHDEKTGYANNRMPLWILPEKKISPRDLMDAMRDHLEGTELDMTKDAGAGPFGIPYRWRPMTWKVDDENYCNERATGTQQTGFSFIAQQRNWLPDAIGGINWFSVDNASTTVYVPIYAGTTKPPHSYEVGNGDLLTYSESAAFWVFSKVTNFTYLRWSYIYPDVRKVQQELEANFEIYTPAIDAAAKTLYETNPELALEFLTDYSVNAADNTVKRWDKLYEYLLVKYIDGNVKKEKDGKFLRNQYGNPAFPDQPGYPESWYKMVKEDHGDQLKVKGAAH